MGPAKSRQEVVQCGLIGDVHGCQLQCCFQFLSMKQVICADTNVEQIAGCNARRIVVRIICTGRWDHESRCPVVPRARADSVNHRCDLIPTKEINVSLLSRCECESIGKRRNRTGYFTAVKPPGEICPRAVLLVLIPQKCGLLKGLIMINSEYARAERRIKNDSSGFGPEVASA